MMDDFTRLLDEQLKNPVFRAEWEKLQPERAVVKAMIDAQNKFGLTKKQLAERSGLAQADISKLENGTANPSIRTLQKLAAGMDMVLHIEFVPATDQ